MSKCVVIGALDGVGLQILMKLIETSSSDVARIHAVDKNAGSEDYLPRNFPQDPRVKFIKGDYKQPHTIRGSIEDGCSVFLASACCDSTESVGSKYHSARSATYGRVEVAAVAAVARLCMEANVRRLVFVSRQSSAIIAARRPDPLASMLAEQRVRESGADYTVVRLGLLVDFHPGHTEAGGRAELSCPQRADWEIGTETVQDYVPTARADAAGVCVAAMQARCTRNTTFDVVSSMPVGPETAEIPLQPIALFSRLDSAFDHSLKDLLPAGLVEETIAHEQADFPVVKTRHPLSSTGVFSSLTSLTRCVTRPLSVLRGRSKGSRVGYGQSSAATSSTAMAAF
eukprot:TRINITY_DN61056_c0_g1_i1.p1 TRINITY_DN61056_c0_g1~~TRINITY_DN61056_c0_g1_i1.p1  ORF type:complete len:342 (-),score=57.75 TRINITY_DN61056_c0_g1_i1:156-1181(-)